MTQVRFKSREQRNARWIGVDIGGTKTAISIANRLPEILARVEFPTLPEQGPDRAIRLIKEHIHHFLHESHLDKRELRAIGVSCGGPLDSSLGLIQTPPNLRTWVDIPITSILRDEFQIPCMLENDANAGAIAECLYGAGQGTRHMVFITMGTGFGAGIIVNGQLLRGASGQAGEIGHVRLTPSGPVGYNKAGSAEGWASGGGIAQVAAQEVSDAVRRGEATLLAQRLGDKGAISAKDVAEAAEQGDSLAARIIHETGGRLGEALAILIDLFNPERIVIGGLAMRLGEKLLRPARSVVDREALPASAKLCQIVPAALSENIGDVSALCIAMKLLQGDS
jgi:glucokinase